MKKCNRCDDTKVIGEFYKNPTSRDGHVNQCKDCTRAGMRDRKTPAGRPQYYRNWKKTRKGKASVRRSRLKYKITKRQQSKASDAVNNAVRDGRLTKPSECSRCGVLGRVEGHHKDYSKPLEVEWLCDLCHKDVHKQERIERRKR